ncbi:MAG: hypothetical protein ACKOYK_04990 [Cyanobium sp.]
MADQHDSRALGHMPIISHINQGAGQCFASDPLVKDPDEGGFIQVCGVGKEFQAETLDIHWAT